MSINRQLREQIDVCRPGSDDLALPALAELAAAAEHDRAVAAELLRSQRFDRAVSAALQDLPAPAGLMERLLAAVEANKPALPAPIEQTPSRWTRRRLLLAAGSLAAVALLAVTAVLFVPRPQQQVTQEELSLAVAEWVNGRGVVPSDWVATPLPTKFAIPSSINRKQPSRWRPLAASGDGWSGSGVAMDLNPPTGAPAMLFVGSSKARFGVPSVPTRLPVSGLPGGRMKAVAWQNPTTNLLYVLVVTEDRGQRLEDFLHHRPEA